MGWIEFLGITKFKWIANGAVLILLQFYFYNIAETLRYCPIIAKPCFSAFGTLMIFNITKVMPIIIATYLLSCMFEFLYKLFKG